MTKRIHIFTNKFQVGDVVHITSFGMQGKVLEVDATTSKHYPYRVSTGLFIFNKSKFPKGLWFPEEELESINDTE